MGMARPRCACSGMPLPRARLVAAACADTLPLPWAASSCSWSGLWPQCYPVKRLCPPLARAGGHRGGEQGGAHGEGCGWSAWTRRTRQSLARKVCIFSPKATMCRTVQPICKRTTLEKYSTKHMLLHMRIAIAFYSASSCHTCENLLPGDRPCSSLARYSKATVHGCRVAPDGNACWRLALSEWRAHELLMRRI